MSMPFYDKVKLIDIYAQDWLRKNNSQMAKPRELMPYLIEKGVFTHDHREGLPLRVVLRKLDKNNETNLIRGLTIERKRKNRYWYFRLI